MQLSDFYYDLPSELIAQVPLTKRSHSRLLCLNGANGNLHHRYFYDLPFLLKPHDLLVFNNTRVIPARLLATKTTGGRVEILVERILGEKKILAQVRASKSSKKKSLLILVEGTLVEVLDRQDEFFTLYFHSEESALAIIEKIGHIPLPPYIHRMDEASDRERYQTIYAKEKGAVAAPTAGLHFDTELMVQLEKLEIQLGYLTLHVGAGTFQPVRVDKLINHRMHKEFINVSAELCQQIKATKEKGGRVIAVGTTAVRSLETAAKSGVLNPFQGDTDIFIYPGFSFQCIDAMITNFHLPESTLLMLVSAFVGYENIMHAYQIAVKKKYRFFSYGDAMFLTR